MTVPIGTPKTFAPLKPEYTIPIIFPRCCGAVNNAVKANILTTINAAAADDKIRPITKIEKLGAIAIMRSEERRVGKEGREGRSEYQTKGKRGILRSNRDRK